MVNIGGTVFCEDPGDGKKKGKMGRSVSDASFVGGRRIADTLGFITPRARVSIRLSSNSNVRQRKTPLGTFEFQGCKQQPINRRYR